MPSFLFFTRLASTLARPVRAMRWLAISILLASALSACSVYRKCGFDGCVGDATLSAAVLAEFARRTALGPPDTIRLQTLDRVVYLSGMVDTERERRVAESVAAGVPGVARVVNNIAVLTDGY